MYSMLWTAPSQGYSAPKSGLSHPWLFQLSSWCLYKDFLLIANVKLVVGLAAESSLDLTAGACGLAVVDRERSPMCFVNAQPTRGKDSLLRDRENSLFRNRGARRQMWEPWQISFLIKKLLRVISFCWYTLNGYLQKAYCGFFFHRLFVIWLPYHFWSVHNKFSGNVLFLLCIQSRLVLSLEV